jgi:hypothetical protein
VRLHQKERARYERLLCELESASETQPDFAAGLTMTLDATVEYALQNAG